MSGLLRSTALLPLIPPTPFSHKGLGADRTFEQRCVFWRCNGQSALTPTPLPHCGRGANLKQVYRVAMLSQACIAHIFCPLLNPQGEKGVGPPDDQNERRNAGLHRKTCSWKPRMRGGLCDVAHSGTGAHSEAPHVWGTVSRGSSANPTWLGKPRMRGGLWSDARMRGLARTVGVTPSARRGDARMRGLARTVGVTPSARRGDARMRGLARTVGVMEIENLFRYPVLAVGLKPSARRGDARRRGLERIISSKTIRSRLAG
jgi:hypothetical protein